jgi:hypothetical protein
MINELQHNEIFIYNNFKCVHDYNDMVKRASAARITQKQKYFWDSGDLKTILSIPDFPDVLVTFSKQGSHWTKILCRNLAQGHERAYTVYWTHIVIVSCTFNIVHTLF